MIFQLDKNDISFPDPSFAGEDGLLAVGGDLSTERLIPAYHHGIFPWYSEEEPILWFAPHERFVLFPEKIHISKSMKRLMNSCIFQITLDHDFKSVIEACATSKRKDQPGTWINPDMQQAYLQLHELGIAHSVEVWKDGRLAGGLYGVAVNNCFCGESMFSNISNSSKAALIWLCRNTNFQMIDCQIESEHLQRMGAETITRKQYLDLLNS